MKYSLIKMELKYWLFKMESFLLEKIYNAINYIDEKLGFVERFKGEDAPYCGHGYSIYEGKFTCEIYHDIYTAKYTKLPIWNIHYDDHVKQWMLENTLSLTIHTDYYPHDSNGHVTFNRKYFGFLNCIKGFFKKCAKIEGYNCKRRFEFSLYRK